MISSKMNLFNEAATTPAVELLAEACVNYLNEMNNNNERHIDKAERALRLAMKNAGRYLDLKNRFKSSVIEGS